MMDQFERTALMFGNDGIETLKNRRVAVFGIGGVGGHCVEALCRTGIGSLDLFDGDIVDVTNINRQIIATFRTIGCNKVDVMRERLLDINPGADIEARKLFYLPETADEVDLSVYDYIVDAVDTMTAKLELICRATGLRIPVISSMGAANKCDPTAFEVADIYETSICPVARIMRGPWAAIQISGHLPRYGGSAKVALCKGKNGESRLTSLPSESHNARMVATASSKRATGLDQSTP